MTVRRLPTALRGTWLPKAGGMIVQDSGFRIQDALGHGGLPKDVVVLVSRTFVDPIDPCLLVPTKVVGSLCDESSAHFLGAIMKVNAGTEIIGPIPASSG